jgi:hypothetical protein
MKISPTILNSSSALGSGSVSQCALRLGKGLVSGARDPQGRGHPDRAQRRAEGASMEFYRGIWPLR